LAGEKKSLGTAKACPRSPKIQPWSNDSKAKRERKKPKRPNRKVSIT